MKAIFTFILCILFTNLFSQNTKQSDSLQLAVNSFHKGFIEQNPNLSRSAISSQLNMFNGNSSANASDWEAHMFLQAGEIKEWLEWMIENAGPFKNDITFKAQHMRSNSAIIVTEESGSNKFRSWKNEEVVYQLGKISGIWKILSIYIRNLKNPE
ncbi:hypothetical protein RXV94_11915 [Yeosuana sp. MJ-SS3]|uniref:Nuclear transport factor 2 family protein n=1 Tax=Gilvirhabdus luticola TaxID=3079858 RepID=A0ABU3U8X6_9FLAO|nr:hypothetical protein [Yeosuana sp. MJ-SS3]MDU8886870.1 hypothetical protein [Yeosuana sp. MJ-SS3]